MVRLERRSMERPIQSRTKKMTHRRTGGHHGDNGRNECSVNVGIRAQTRSGCPFCSLIMTLYPTLEGMPGMDSTIFRTHLKKKHGLMDEIQP